MVASCPSPAYPAFPVPAELDIKYDGGTVTSWVKQGVCVLEGNGKELDEPDEVSVPVGAFVIIAEGLNDAALGMEKLAVDA